jgi:hypothetical protein
MTAVAFACGLGVGVVLGAALWSAALHFGKLSATAEHRKIIALERQSAVAQNNRLAKAKADMRARFGNELTADQERILEDEIGKVFREFPHPQIPKRD